MNTTIATSPQTCDCRQRFRQHYLDLDPLFGREGIPTAAEATREHWILSKPLLRSMVVRMAIDLRKLGSWNGDFDDLDNQQLLQLVIERTRMDAYEAEPASSWSFLRFMAKFVFAGIRESVKLQMGIARASGALRRSRY